MAIPGAEGPTSLGGPNGPALLRAPASPRSQSPGSSAPVADPALPPLHFAPEESRNFGPARFPLEALLAPDRNRALDRWASSSPRSASAGLASQDPSIAQDVPSNLDRPPVGGLLGMIQEYMRNNGY
jgi:hypothetical protein